MIKANELRIGNYYDQFGHTHQVTWVVIKDLESAPKDQLWCKPIPLTEEWLIRFGGIRSANNWLIADKIELAYITTDEYYEFEWQSPCMNWSIVPVKYVHQLQNIFYNLFQIELITTEPNP
jgi:hypothetical protein